MNINKVTKITKDLSQAAERLNVTLYKLSLDIENDRIEEAARFERKLDNARREAEDFDALVRKVSLYDDMVDMVDELEQMYSERYGEDE